MWWCCVHVIFVVDSQKKVIANVFAQKLQPCLSLSTRNKINYGLFVSI